MQEYVLCSIVTRGKQKNILLVNMQHLYSTFICYTVYTTDHNISKKHGKLHKTKIQEVGIDKWYIFIYSMNLSKTFISFY